MRRYLVLADRAFTPSIHEVIASHIGDGHVEVRVVLPAVNTTGHPALATPVASGGRETVVGRDHRSASAQLRARETAQARLRLVTSLLENDLPNAKISGAVGAPDPVEAIENLTATHAFNEILVCTPPQWLVGALGLDLVSRVRRQVDVPVVHLTTKE